MNETLGVINNRRSIRKYKSTQIADTEVQAIMKAALNAPTARNQQKWHFTVIQDLRMLDKMVNIIQKNLLNSGIQFHVERASTPGYHTFHHAPTVILISSDEKAEHGLFDCALAAENIIIAAESLNIGSRCITSAGFLFASPEGNEFKKKLGIPTGYNFVCTIALGYKDGDNPVAPPKNPDVVTYIK